MTHIDNMSHIFAYGMTHVDSLERNPNYVAIGNTDIIAVRNNRLLANGRMVGSYLPFYFGYHTPMLYVIQNGYTGVAKVNPEEIIYCVTSVQVLLDSGKDFLFTDGQANSALTSCFLKSDIQRIEDLLDFSIINSKDWSNTNEDPDRKRRKESELLLDGDLPVNCILGYVCYNEQAKVQLMALGIVEEKIAVRSNYYF